MVGKDALACGSQADDDPAPVTLVHGATHEATSLQAIDSPRQGGSRQIDGHRQLASPQRPAAQLAEDATLGEGQARRAPESKKGRLDQGKDLGQGVDDVPRRHLIRIRCHYVKYYATDNGR